MPKINEIASVLASETRLEIIKILSDQARTVNDIFKEIKKNNRIPIKYRESVYRSLERLVDVGLVEKYYDMGICYKLLAKRIELDLIDGTAKLYS